MESMCKNEQLRMFINVLWNSENRSNLEIIEKLWNTCITEYFKATKNVVEEYVT